MASEYYIEEHEGYGERKIYSFTKLCDYFDDLDRSEGKTDNEEKSYKWKDFVDPMGEAEMLFNLTIREL